MKNGYELENNDDIKNENKCKNNKPREYDGIINEDEKNQIWY